QLLAQLPDGVAAAIVGEEKMAAGAQHARDLAEEDRPIRIGAGGLDIQDDVEALVREGEVLSVAMPERQAGSGMTIAAEGDGLGRDVQSDQATRLEIARDIGGAAAAAATDFQPVAARPVHGTRDMVV